MSATCTETQRGFHVGTEKLPSNHLLVALIVNTLTSSIIGLLNNYLSLLLIFILRYSLKLHSIFYFVTIDKNMVVKSLILFLKYNY